MKLPIYLDNQSTTRVDPRVVEEMLPYFSEAYGNAASVSHPHGWIAKDAVGVARHKVAEVVSAEPSEVIFTSGATESINLILKGFARGKPWKSIRIITSVVEHSAVLDTCAYLEGLGASVVRLPVLPGGQLDMGILEKSLSAGADLVSLIHANNEIGTINPIDSISELCRKYDALLHFDAAQSFGKIPIDFGGGSIDFMSVSGHKIYGPKGVGCLLIKRRMPPLRLIPLIHGGGHERGFRSGTLNIPGIVGLGRAAEICANGMMEEAGRIAGLRDLLLELILKDVIGTEINGSMTNRLAGNLNVSFTGIDGQLLLPALRGKISVSSGSACTSASQSPSHVLKALGGSDELSHASLRFGIGRFNTEEEIRYAAQITASVIADLRAQKSGSQ